MLRWGKKGNDMHKGLWNGLGGKLEEGETPEQCAVREMKEESGLSCKQPTLRGLLTFPHNVGMDAEAWYVFVYEFNEYEGTLIEESTEGMLAWIDDEKLLELPLNEGDYLWLPWLLERKLFSGRFVYDKKKLKEWDVTFH